MVIPMKGGKMKRNTLLNKALLLSLSAVISMSILAGCQSKNAKANTAKQGTTKGQRQNGQLNTGDMKKKMEENLNSLVADGTINQSQADKILEALTANPQGFGGNRQKNNQNGNQNNGQQNGQQNNGENKQNSNNQNKKGNNALNKLVTDGVITQVQADAVMQKIRGSLNRNQNNPSNQNNQNNQNGSNENKTS
jgi:major membrane immunogen (membrane-anchored lipoprotein)